MYCVTIEQPTASTVGTLFSEPGNLAALVEVVQTEATADTALAFTDAVGLKYVPFRAVSVTPFRGDVWVTWMVRVTDIPPGRSD